MAATLLSIPKHDHPAVYSDQLLDTLAAKIKRSDLVVDVFGGTGRIHLIAEMAKVAASIGVELEPEWANADLFDALPRLQIVGDCRLVLPQIVAEHGLIPCIATSPTYANRMGDKHKNRDKCKPCNGGGCNRCKGSGLSRRNTYTHRLGRELTDGNTGGMNWGPDYRLLHAEAWAIAVRSLAPGGKFVLNVKNHIRRGVEVDVTDWHVRMLTDFGLKVKSWDDIECPGQRNGANRDKRVETEAVIVFTKPRPRTPRKAAAK